MRKIILVLSVLVIVQAFNQIGSAQVYKYVDKDGVVHFTDSPADSKYQKAEGIGWDDSRGVAKKTPSVTSQKWPQPENFVIRKFSNSKSKNRR